MQKSLLFILALTDLTIYCGNSSGVVLLNLIKQNIKKIKRSVLGCC